MYDTKFGGIGYFGVLVSGMPNGGRHEDNILHIQLPLVYDQTVNPYAIGFGNLRAREGGTPVVEGFFWGEGGG